MESASAKKKMVLKNYCALLSCTTIVILLASECSSNKGINSIDMPIQNPENLNFKSEIFVGAEQTLIIKYSIVNNSKEIVYLFNKLYSTLSEEGTYNCDRNLAYTYLEKEVLIIKKAIPTIPDDIDIEKPIVPCVTKVIPGESFSEQFILDFPIKLYNPYSKSTKDFGNNASFNSIQLQLGYFSISKKSEEMEKEVKTTDGNAWIFEPFDINVMKLLSNNYLIKGAVEL